MVSKTIEYSGTKHRRPSSLTYSNLSNQKRCDLMKKKPLSIIFIFTGITVLFLALFFGQAAKKGGLNYRKVKTDQLNDPQLRTAIEFDLPERQQADKQRKEDRAGQEEPPVASGVKENGIIPSKEAEVIIADVANAVMQALSTKDTEKLASYVHPVKGVRFTPYTYVDCERDLVFTKSEIRNFFKDQQHYLWGYYDGSGAEIILTPSEYYARFIYSADFINAEQIGYNQILSTGNMLENQFEVYENPIIVEYYFSGFDPAYEGMDWQSLRLVFEEYEEEWRLTGIIHNQWTI